jgi:hypothetical protein
MGYGACFACYDRHPHLINNDELYSLENLFGDYPHVSTFIPEEKRLYCKDCLEDDSILDILSDIVRAGLWFFSMAEAKKFNDKWLMKQLWGVEDIACPGCGETWGGDNMIKDDKIKRAVFKTYAQINKVPNFLRNKFRVCLSCCEKAELRRIKSLKDEDLPLSIHKFFTPKGKNAFEARLKTC